MTIKTHAPQETEEKSSAFETIRQAADDYITSDKPLYITAKDLCGSIVETGYMARLEMETYNPDFHEGPVIVDLRSPDSEMPELYYHGHIPGAIHIPWRKITQLKTLTSLPRDRKIVVYSNIGQTGGQAAAILSIMGYDVVNLKWGMTSWTGDRKAAPDRYVQEKEIIWQNRSYRNTVTTTHEWDKAYPLPDLHTDGKTPSAVIWSAADDYLDGYRPANISATALYDPLFEYFGPFAVSPYEEDGKDMLVIPFGYRPSENEEWFDWPFILDIRESNIYVNGHIPGSINIPWFDVFQKENLRKIPADRRIVVCSETGHTSAHITALLNVLGYDAVNLKWGMSGWSLKSEDGIRDFTRYDEEKDCMDYPIVKGWNPGRVLTCKA
ncbi:MAG: rhodanese-like domain-containing protein [Dehalococcoidales bacterium]|nr:MAG: rhodanese-like domain-containing protein [Dehalococcoidales bacterium]